MIIATEASPNALLTKSISSVSANDRTFIITVDV